MLSKTSYPLLIAVLLTAWITACGNSQEKVASADVGEITVYTSLSVGTTQTALAAFEKEYPRIRVKLVTDNSHAHVNRLIADKDNPQADAIWGVDVTSVLYAEWMDILKTYSPAGLDQINARFRDSNNPPHWVGMGMRVTIFCLNTDKLARLELPPPQSWDDLFNPIYEGHLVMPNPMISGNGYLILSAILQIYGEVEGAEHLYMLHRNIYEYLPSNPQLCEMVGAGIYPIAISFDGPCVDEKEKGKPVKRVIPEEGPIWNIGANALIKKEHIKPAAKTFLDWAISDKAIELYEQDRAITIASGRHPELVEQLFDQDIPWMAANRERILKRWLSHYAVSIAQSESE